MKDMNEKTLSRFTQVVYNHTTHCRDRERESELESMVARMAQLGFQYHLPRHLVPRLLLSRSS